MSSCTAHSIPHTKHPRQLNSRAVENGISVLFEPTLGKNLASGDTVWFWFQTK